MTELKPCPFCGETNLSWLIRQDFGFYHKHGIRCNTCRFTMLFDCDSENEHHKYTEGHLKWNRRVEE